MISFERYVLFIAATTALIQGIVIAMRKDATVIRRVFFLVESMACAIWAIWLALFIAESDVDKLTSIASVYYIAALFISWSWLPLTYSFMNKKDSTGALTIALIALVPLLAAVSVIFIQPSFLIDSVHISSNNFVILNSVGYLIYSFLFVLYALIAFAFLAKGYGLSKNTLERKQRLYLLIASAALFIFGSYFNLLLPGLGNYNLIWIGPINIIIFSSIVYGAIMRYGLFNIKLRVARLLAGSAVLITIFWFRFWLSSVIYSGNEIQAQVFLLDAVISVIYLLASYFIIQFLLRSSSRFFGSGLLDESLSSEVSEQSLSSTDTVAVFRNIVAAISGRIKADFVAIIADTGDDKILETDSNTKIDISSIEPVIEYMAKRKLNILATEDLDLSDPMYSVLRALEISAVAKSQTSSNKKSIATYLIIGNEARTSYSNREAKALSSISGIILIALENTLYYDRIKKFNQELENRVGEATVDLRSMNNKLKRIDDSKDDFISMASHQLRTPLTSVKGYISMLLDGDFGHISGEQRKILTEVYSNSERMAFLISDFLDVSRLQAGKFELQKSPTDLSKLLDSEISQLKLTAKTHNVLLKYDIPDKLPILDLDHNKIRQVMMNMIDNAIYYSHGGDHVVVNLYSQEGKVVFTVRDFGIGVPRAEQPKLFTKFYRASNAQKVRPDGTGVGLYMARKVVAAHGGSIIFDSHEDKGSTFGFKLPIR